MLKTDKKIIFINSKSEFPLIIFDKKIYYLFDKKLTKQCLNFDVIESIKSFNGYITNFKMNYILIPEFSLFKNLNLIQNYVGELVNLIIINHKIDYKIYNFFDIVSINYESIEENNNHDEIKKLFYKILL